MNSFLKKSETTQNLLDNYIFIIVPMFNIEGVIMGNFRCCPVGLDPNRLWIHD